MTTTDLRIYCGDLGEPVKHVEFEPFPEFAPIEEPVAVPERELEPAK